MRKVIHLRRTWYIRKDNHHTLWDTVIAKVIHLIFIYAAFATIFLTCHYQSTVAIFIWSLAQNVRTFPKYQILFYASIS